MPKNITIWKFIHALECHFVSQRGPGRGESKIQGFCVGREQHKSGRIHFHTYLRLHKKSYFKPTWGDVELSGVKYHGRYESVRSVNAVLTYCRKGGDYIQHNLIRGLAHTVINSRDQFDMLMALDRAGRHRQRSFWSRAHELHQQRRRHQSRVQLTRHVISFPWFERFIRPETVMGWLKPPDRRPKGLLLAGPSETGKTSFIVKLAGGRPYFMATQPRHFCNYAGETVIALDQFSWAKWRAQVPFLKSLVTGFRVATPSYYGSHLLATPRIVVVCTNQDPRQWGMPAAMNSRFYLFRTDTQHEWRWDDGAWHRVDAGAASPTTETSPTTD